MEQPGTIYRDSHGKGLEDYPRPSVAVDTAVLTVMNGRLCTLLTRTDGSAPDRDHEQWRLPGTFLWSGERLADAVSRSLQVKAGITGLTPRQLRVFDDPARDDRGWVISVAHLATLPADRIPPTDRTHLVPIDDVGQLSFDHAAIISAAVGELRSQYRRLPDPAQLLSHAGAHEPDGSFVIRELRLLHEAVLDERWNPDTFRRTMLPALKSTGRWRTGARGKPAELFTIAHGSLPHE